MGQVADVFLVGKDRVGPLPLHLPFRGRDNTHHRPHQFIYGDCAKRQRGTPISFRRQRHFERQVRCSFRVCAANKRLTVAFDAFAVLSTL